MMRATRLYRSSLILLTLLFVMPSGCAMMKAIGYYAAPRTEKIAPEFNRLPGRSVLVYVWAPPEILWDYPKFRLDIAAHVGAYLEQNVEEVDVLDPVRTEAFLERASNPEQDPPEIGRRFQSEVVIHLAVYEFSVRDPGMSQFLRGRLGSSVTVYDLNPPDGMSERVPLEDVEVVVPEEGPVGFMNAEPAQVRQATYDAFAVAVGRKFHEYERSLE